MDQYDAVIVGGSLAGCATARLLARRGARVALVEKRPSLEAYKVICGHFIQAGAAPAMERLGLVPLLEEVGAVPSKVDIWARWGWMRASEGERHGWSLRRSTLDPMVRKLAMETDGVDYLPGLTAMGLEGTGRVAGVHVRERDGSQRVLSGRVVVGADGRDSSMARLAGVRARIRPHARFGYFAYFEDVPLRQPNRAMMWLSDPDVAFVFPNEQGITAITVMPAKQRLAEFRGDPERAVRAHFRTLADAPELDGARRVSKWIGKLEMPNAIRPASAPGIAFVGDAAQASDPVFGVGCGWAFQSAEWLAEELGAALRGSERDIDRALVAYARRHRRELGAHHFIISDYSSARGFSPVEKLFFSTAARDRTVAGRLEEVGTRSVRGIEGTARVLTGIAKARLGLTA